MINSQADIQLRARTNLYPDGIIRWTNESEEYEYEGGSGSQPTQEEIDAEIKRLQAEEDSQEYARKRQAEYPTIQELVVALYDTDDKSAVEAKRAAVKAKFPKPE